MGEEYFDQATVDHLRTAIQQAAGLDYEPPDGWSKSLVDPARILRALPSLTLEEGYRLCGFLFTSGGDGNGIVWALPDAAAFPEADLCGQLWDRFADPPKPHGAVEPMKVISGDGTPESYLCASLLAREFLEFGARWHGCGWSTHMIVCVDPWSGQLTWSDGIEPSPVEGWEWKVPVPEDWRASVSMKEGRATVVFYTFTGLGRESIIRFTDEYELGQYEPTSREEAVAEGAWGYIF